MDSFPEPRQHPLKSDSLFSRYARALFLASLCEDYAIASQDLVDRVLARDDPYRGGKAEALLAITAAREVVRTGAAVVATSDMDIFFASGIQCRLDKFNKRHSHLKNARDIIAHVDEYVSSKGRLNDQWFDTTSRFGEDQWVFRVGNKLDIDMVELASDCVNLAKSIATITSSAAFVEHHLDFPTQIALGLMERGFNVHINVDVASGTMEIYEMQEEDNLSEGDNQVIGGAEEVKPQC